MIGKQRLPSWKSEEGLKTPSVRGRKGVTKQLDRSGRKRILQVFSELSARSVNQGTGLIRTTSRQ
jgi:hypothetical protein